MSIASRQVIKELNRIIEERIRDGFVPTVEYLIYQLSLYYQKVSVGSPSFKARLQPYRKLWDINAYNNNISEIYDDINNLYEELVSQFTIVLRDFDYTDTERMKLMHLIRALEGEVQNLLLISADTEGYLYSVYDDFKDRSKVDLGYSTCEVNTDAGICTIRESKSGISKIDMSHYFNLINFPILASKEYADNILSNTILTGSKFGYAFSDVGASWIQNIITRVPGKLVVSFIMDLTPDDPAGTLISRIEVYAQSPNPMKIEPLWSLDNINFTKIPIGYGETEKMAAVGTSTVWNFTETTVRYVKFVITKDQEDEHISVKDSPAYRYVVGFNTIEFYKMGYDNSSVLYSKAFTLADATGEDMTIDKAALVVDQDVENGTKIDYYLSLGVVGETNPENFNWVPVSAINDPIPTQQQIVDFKHVASFSDVPDLTWNSSTYGNPIKTYQGINFYTVYTFPYIPVKDSVTLYRGKNDWQVNPRYTVSRMNVYEEKHIFGAGNTVTLSYPNFTPVDGQGLIRGTVRVKNEPGANPGFVYSTPNDFSVNYSNYTVTKPAGSTISSDINSPRNTVYIDYQYDKETAIPSEYITYVYVLNANGIDINIRAWTADEISAGQYTTIETGGITLDVSSLSFYHLTPGWHRVITTGQPFTAADRFYAVNGNKRLHQLVYTQYAFSTPLQEVSWFELQYNTKLNDHTKYCVTDFYGNGIKELIVNYRPQTAIWSSGKDLLCYNAPETYVISYKFISAITNNIYFKAVLSRNTDTSPLFTPTLRSYTIKTGY